MKVKYMSFLLHFTVHCDLLNMYSLTSYIFLWGAFAFVIIDDDIADDETNIYGAIYFPIS